VATAGPPPPGSLPGSLPGGPHPTAGPQTVTMPPWPGPALAIVGALLTVGGLVAAELAAGGDLGVDRGLLGWAVIVGAVALVAGLLYTSVRQLRVRRHLPPDRYRGPAVLVLLFLVLALTLIVTLPFGADAAALLDGLAPSALGAVVLLTATQVGMLLVSWLLVFRPGALAGLPSLPGRDPAGAILSGIGWGLLAAVGAGLVATAVTAVLEALGITAESQVVEQAFYVVDPWLAVISGVLLAPIAEEVFFRGVAFNALLREGGRRWAYLGSAALFAIVHLDLAAAVPLFLLGLALAWVYERSRTLLAPIAMHVAINGLAVAVALMDRFGVIEIALRPGSWIW
jgi:membrane protease YdiL (CAAX protease family)